jgi:hypothetical protein
MTENETPLDLLDLGDAIDQTKQISPAPIVPDNWFGWSWPY